MDVKALQARIAAFAAERGWDELHNPRNLAIAIAGEAGMLLDLFRWLTDAQSHRIESEYKRDAAEEAIADLLLHTLRIADKLGIDVDRAVAKKLAENDANYPLPVAEPAPRAAREPAVAASEPKPAPVAAPEPTPLPATQEAPAPAEPKKVTPPEAGPPPEAAPKPKLPPEHKKATRLPEPSDRAAMVEAKEERSAAEPPKPSPDKALPSWLDGIMPGRTGTARKKPAAAARPEPEPPKAPPPPRAPEPPSPPPAARVVEAIEAIEAAPPPVADGPEAVEPSAPEPPWELERYAHLDTDAAKGFVKSLAKRVDGARSDDPLLRELHDEVETLRRTLYSPTPKYSWMGDSLKTIRAILEEASSHSVSEEIRARDYIAQIDRMLTP